MLVDVVYLCISSKAVEQSLEPTRSEVVVGDSVEEPPEKERLAVKTVVAKVKPKKFWCLC